MKPCRVCDNPYRTEGLPGNRAALRRLLGPRWRATLGGFRDWVCWQCVVEVARYVRDLRRRMMSFQPQRQTTKGDHDGKGPFARECGP